MTHNFEIRCVTTCKLFLKQKDALLTRSRYKVVLHSPPYWVFLSTNLCAPFAWFERWLVDFLISTFVTYLNFWSRVKMVHVLYCFLLIHNIGWLQVKDTLGSAWCTLFNTKDACWFLLTYEFMSQKVLF